MSYEAILYDVDGHVATITLNRPDKLNAWTRQMEQEVRSAVEAAQDDEQIRAIVITGAGRGFCAGADMSLLTEAAGGDHQKAEPSPSGPDVADGDTIETNYQQRFSYLLRINKPIVAAINGPVAGIDTMD